MPLREFSHVLEHEEAHGAESGQREVKVGVAMIHATTAHGRDTPSRGT